MGRGAVAITVMSDAGDPVQLVTTHLKSKLLTFPHGRFEPRDEDERARLRLTRCTGERRSRRPCGPGLRQP